MKKMAAVIRARWENFDEIEGFVAGMIFGLVTTLVPALMFSGEAFMFGFLCLFPFFARLTLRAAFVGPYFHQFFATRLGLFCVGWFFTFLFLGWAFFGLT